MTTQNKQLGGVTSIISCSISKHSHGENQYFYQQMTNRGRRNTKRNYQKGEAGILGGKIFKIIDF